MATFCDPRDAAVAVYDIAPIERQVGSARSFSRVRSMKDAIDLISDNLWNLQTWLDEPAVLQISFRELSQSPMISCSRIAQHIGIAVDSAKIMAQFQSGARPIKEFNKGTAGRYKFIMNEDDLQYCQESFGDMMDRIARLSNPRAG